MLFKKFAKEILMNNFVMPNRPFLNETMLALGPAGAVCIACGGNLTNADQATDPSEANPPQAYVSLFCTREGCSNAFRNAGEFNSTAELNAVLREWGLRERARLAEVGNNDVFLVAFGVFDEPGGPVLCGQAEGNFQALGFANRAGHKYENWHQLTGTLSEIFGRPRADFEVLRTDVLRSQRVTRRQLRLLGIPGMQHLTLTA